MIPKVMDQSIFKYINEDTDSNKVKKALYYLRWVTAVSEMQKWVVSVVISVSMMGL